MQLHLHVMNNEVVSHNYGCLLFMLAIATSILKLQGILSAHRHVLCGFSVEIGNCFSPCTLGEVYCNMNTLSHTKLDL